MQKQLFLLSLLLCVFCVQAQAKDPHFRSHEAHQVRQSAVRTPVHQSMRVPAKVNHRINPRPKKQVNRYMSGKDKEVLR